MPSISHIVMVSKPAEFKMGGKEMGKSKKMETNLPSFKLREEKFRLDIRKKNISCEALEQVSLRSCGCLSWGAL